MPDSSPLHGHGRHGWRRRAGGGRGAASARPDSLEGVTAGQPLRTGARRARHADDGGRRGRLARGREAHRRRDLGGRRRHRRHGHDRRDVDAHRPREDPPRRGRQGRRGRSREDHHGRRLERDRARDRALPALRAGRRRRHHDRHAVLQQADPGRHPHALPARGRRHRPAGHPLRHPGPHRRADQVRDDPPAREAPEHPRDQRRQGRLLRGEPGAQPDRPHVLLGRRRQRAAAPRDRRDRASSASPRTSRPRRTAPSSTP